MDSPFFEGNRAADYYARMEPLLDQATDPDTSEFDSLLDHYDILDAIETLEFYGYPLKPEWEAYRDENTPEGIPLQELYNFATPPQQSDHKGEPLSTPASQGMEVTGEPGIVQRAPSIKMRSFRDYRKRKTKETQTNPKGQHRSNQYQSD